LTGDKYVVEDWQRRGARQIAEAQQATAGQRDPLSHDVTPRHTHAAGCVNRSHDVTGFPITPTRPASAREWRSSAHYRKATFCDILGYFDGRPEGPKTPCFLAVPRILKGERESGLLLDDTGPLDHSSIASTSRTNRSESSARNEATT
jgi:hypothetical protein